ncbi:MAG: hypothetical protein AAFS11_00880, partial [Planctomycetota bacterium]
TKMLFGGALLSAGMAADASAQSFTLPGNPKGNDTFWSTSYYYADNSFASGYSNANGGFGDGFDGVGAEVSIEATQLFATADGAGLQDPNDVAYTLAQSYAFVSVTGDGLLDLAWDFTAEGTRGFIVPGRVLIVDLSGPSVIIFETDQFSAGTGLVPVFAGNTYAIWVVASASRGETAFATVTLIPAPASVALIGFAGLVATRRHR